MDAQSRLLKYIIEQKIEAFMYDMEQIIEEDLDWIDKTCRNQGFTDLETYAYKNFYKEKLKEYDVIKRNNYSG